MFFFPDRLSLKCDLYRTRGASTPNIHSIDLFEWTLEDEGTYYDPYEHRNVKRPTS